MNFDFLKKIEWTPMNMLKASGLLLAAVIVLSIVFSLVRPIVGPLVGNTRGYNASAPSGAPVVSDASTEYSGKDYNYSENGLSLDNVSMPTSEPGGSVGNDAEEFEVTDYNASIETLDKDTTCAEVSKLKSLDYVIFESSNEHDTGCSYVFKVEHDRVEEILVVIKALDPKNLSENTHTIKQQLDDFTSQADILKKKLVSIDQTLTGAITAYDDITALATRTENVEALAKIINSRIGIIERLTQERINIAAQLERLGRDKAKQLDRLEYTYFYVNVYENKFIDGENIKDSWKLAVKEFVRDINQTIQNVTINLASLLFLLAQYILYLFILLIVVKYFWRIAKYVWQK